MREREIHFIVRSWPAADHEHVLCATNDIVVAKQPDNLFEVWRAVMVGEVGHHLDTYADRSVVHLAGVLVEELAERGNDTIDDRGHGAAGATTTYGQARDRRQVPTHESDPACRASNAVAAPCSSRVPVTSSAASRTAAGACPIAIAWAAHRNISRSLCPSPIATVRVGSTPRLARTLSRAVALLNPAGLDLMSRQASSTHGIEKTIDTSTPQDQPGRVPLSQVIGRGDLLGTVELACREQVRDVVSPPHALGTDLDPGKYGPGELHDRSRIEVLHILQHIPARRPVVQTGGDGAV